jgi:hypothetical protein
MGAIPELEAEAEAGPATEPAMEMEAAAAQDDELATPPKKNYPDRRRWCFRCTYKKYVEVDGQRTPKNMSRLDGSKPKKTITYCMRCEVALCQACFRPWHEQDWLPDTTPATGSV